MSGKVIKKVLDATEELSEFIAGPRPNNPVSGPYHDYTRWVCDSYANIPTWLTTAATVAGAPNVDMGLRLICGEYLGIYTPFGAPPFSGGQCPVVYLVTFSNDGSGPPTATAFVLGPVGGVRVVGPNEFGLYSWEVQEGDGDWSRFRGTSDPDEEWSIDTLSRLDGLPDDCGDPPPVFRPVPGRPADPGPTPPGGGQPPVFDPDGNPTFNPGPIDTPFGPVEHPPIDPFDPGSDIDDPDPYPPLPPGNQGDGDDPQDTGPDGEVEGEAPPGKVLVGLKINLLTIPPYARPFTESVYRAPCYIYMGGESGLDQDYAGSMLRDGQFVFAERENLTRWLVAANTGWNIRVTPYYREVEE